MKLLKNNFYDILRLYINQIGITIFSLVLYTAVQRIDDEAINLKIKVAISVLSTLFYFVLLYTVSWDYGGKDKIRIDAGRLEKNSFKGAAMGLWANVPNFILALLCVVAFGIHMSYENAGNVNAFFDSSSDLLNLFVRFTMAMYLGILQAVFYGIKANSELLYFFWQAVGYLVMPLFAVLATHIGYTFGLKNKKIFPSGKSSQNGKNE